MNVFLRSLTIVALVVCCVQSISSIKQPVRASKKDESDKTKVTVTITPADVQSETSDKQKPISSSTFTKNTDGFAKKLYFDFAKGDNLITVTYSDEKDKEFGKLVQQEAVTATSEIVISKSGVEIKNQALEPEAEKIPATVKITQGAGTWLVVSGTVGLTPNIAKDPEPQPEVLDSKTYAGFEGTLSIYKDKATRIYAKKVATAHGQMTELPARDIEKAGNDPIITIDEKGHARIFSRAEEQTRKALFAKPIQIIKATVVPETRLSIWKVVSGPDGLTQAIVNDVDIHKKGITKPGILDYGLYLTAPKELKVYKNQDTMIYAENIKSGYSGSASSGKSAFTKLIKQDIKKAGNKPLLKIDDDGNVTIHSSQKAATPVASEQQKEMPKTVQLQLFLASHDLNDWRLKKGALDQGQVSDDMLEIIKRTPEEKLLSTPIVAAKIQSLTGEKLRILQGEIERLKKHYVAIYSGLADSYAYYMNEKQESKAVKDAADMLLRFLVKILEHSEQATPAKSVQTVVKSSSQAEKELPETVKLKFLLASKGIRELNRSMAFLKDSRESQKISAPQLGILSNSPAVLLNNTPLVKHKIKQFTEQKPDQLEEFVKKIQDLQPSYGKIYAYLGQDVLDYYWGNKQEGEDVQKEVGTFLKDLQEAIVAR